MGANEHVQITGRWTCALCGTHAESASATFSEHIEQEHADVLAAFDTDA